MKQGKKKKGHKIAQQSAEEEEEAEKSWTKPSVPVEFIGNMQQGVAYIQMITIILIASSAVFVWWTKHEVIFPQRSAPKFVFDFARAMLVVPYAIFWGE